MRHGQGIKKHRRTLREGNAVLVQIGYRLLRVPLVLHPVRVTAPMPSAAVGGFLANGWYERARDESVASHGDAVAGLWAQSVATAFSGMCFNCRTTTWAVTGTL